MIHLYLTVISLEFRCNGSGVARADVTIAVSNRSHHGSHPDIATYHVFSLTKRCGDCHSNGGIRGNYNYIVIHNINEAYSVMSVIL